MGNNFEFMIQKAEDGDFDAKLAVAKKYAKGDGVPQNTEKAYEWYVKLAESEKRSYLLVFMGLLELGCAAGDEFKWCRKAVDEGYAWAQYCLGACYNGALGATIAEDHDEALRLITLAASRGFSHAQVTLGFHYAQGYNVPQDMDKARRWFEKAAEQGNEEAKEILNKLA